mgnify:CR=1 FL=1
MKVTIRGFHGTLASRAESIRKSGIYPSDNRDDWLGDGTYFFIDGLDDPWTSASQWARCKAWDKVEGEFDEQHVAVIEAAISVDGSRVRDLREPEQCRAFHRARRRWLKEQVPGGSMGRERPDETSFDTDFVEHFRAQHGVDVVVGDFYIQLSLRERHFRLDSRIPNVSVLCVAPSPEAEVEILEIQVVPATSFLENGTD